MTAAGVIAISGPTAVGKSAVADRLAVRFGTGVISADAMQVYRGMNIGTAKTPPKDRLAPLYMVDVVDPRDSYSAALYQRDARPIIEDALSLQGTAIVCGGTGLYLRAALDLMDFPSGEVNDERRRRYQALADQLGPLGIHEVLRQLDPESANAIHPNNVRRTIRALEMHDEGQSYAKKKDAFSRPAAKYPYRLFILTCSRDVLYARIDRRVDKMISQGLVDEVKHLISQGAGEAITSRQAIGYKEIMDYLAGTMSLDEAVELIKRRSRRYAKRQLSWWRGDERAEWVDIDEVGIDGAVEFISNQVTVS